MKKLSHKSPIYPVFFKMSIANLKVIEFKEPVRFVEWMRWKTKRIQGLKGVYVRIYS